MQLTIINNPDESRKERYEIARAVYAETAAVSLRAVEAMASMIANAAHARGCAPLEIVRDVHLFTSRNPAAPRNKLWQVRADSSAFQMCLRVVQKMQNGSLGDWCCGATRFHHGCQIPDWATSCGYITEINDILFYL